MKEAFSGLLLLVTLADPCLPQFIQAGAPLIKGGAQGQPEAYPPAVRGRCEWCHCDLPSGGLGLQKCFSYQVDRQVENCVASHRVRQKLLISPGNLVLWHEPCVGVQVSMSGDRQPVCWQSSPCNIIIITVFVIVRQRMKWVADAMTNRERQ